MSRDSEAILKQSEFISKDVEGEERLKKALDEIGTLTKQLYDQKTEFDDKVQHMQLNIMCTGGWDWLNLVHWYVNCSPAHCPEVTWLFQTLQ